MKGFDIGGLAAITGFVLAIISAVVAIVLIMNVQPVISQGLNVVPMHTKNVCAITDTGERYDRLSVKRSAVTETADSAWGRTTSPTNLTVGSIGTTCVLATAGASANVYYTPNGTAITEGSSAAITPASTVVGAAKFLGGTFGTIVTLLVSFVGVLVVAGALGFIIGIGAYLTKKIPGGGGLGLIIGIVIGILVITSMLGTIIQAIDVAYVTYSGVRYALYQIGFGGTLVSTLINFFGFAFIAGITVLGVMVFPPGLLQKVGGSGTGGGRRRRRGRRGGMRRFGRF